MMDDLPLNIETQVIRREPRPSPRLTIGVLLYGDHKDLAERCLSPITRLPLNVELRLGMNEVAESTRLYVMDLFKQETDKGRNVLLYDSTTNRGKYPVMRWMLQDPCNHVRSHLVMWFDDDSILLTPTEAWLASVEKRMATCDMCGALMETKITNRQAAWIQMQPWYKGKPLTTTLLASNNQYVVPWFAVGGWWTAKAESLKRLNWPPQNIVHRGGDYMLGEAMHQNNMVIVEFKDGVAINADADGNSHKATRRGLNPPAVGADYEPSLAAQLHFATKSIDPQLLDYAGL